LSFKYDKLSLVCDVVSGRDLNSVVSELVQKHSGRLFLWISEHEISFSPSLPTETSIMKIKNVVWMAAAASALMISPLRKRASGFVCM
jgi:hypothetical protein